ncbi:MAG: hypothetical protein GY804_06900 [Alphaproteobacteria bacterium]|nr:hypothetical protein [Alphaproteobacteria bacterium]
MKLWEALAEKGKIATIIGFLFALPANGWAVYKLYNEELVTIDQLWVVIAINIIGMFWFMLPSEISIKSSKFQLIVKD